MPNEIVIDARKLGDGGIGVYIENLIDGLTESAVFNKIYLIINPSSSISKWEGQVEFIKENSAKYSFFEYFVMPIKLRKLFSGRIVHFPHYTVPFFMPRSAKIAVTIHDCIHLKSKNFFKRLIAKYLIGHALKKAAAVITVSNYSKSEILKNYNSILSGKISVVPNSISAEPEVKSRANNSDYYLFIGSGREHKGLNLLLPALKNEKLLVVGSSFSAEQVAEIEKSAVLIGKCSNQEIANLYAGAKALIMPSLEEGFGIPVLEALSFGLPVVATPVSSIVEWFGDTVWYANQFSSESLKQALLMMNSNPELREKKIKAGIELAKNFTVKNSTKLTIEIYQKLNPNLIINSPNSLLSKVA